MTTQTKTDKKEKPKWIPQNPGGLPSALPKLTRKQWIQFNKGNLKDIYIKQPGGGKRQLLASEIHLIKSIPRLKKNETNASFQARTERWEGVTGITHPSRDRGVKMSYDTEGASLKGLPRMFGLNRPMDYTGDADWSDSITDLEQQKNYNPSQFQYQVKPDPVFDAASNATGNLDKKDKNKGAVITNPIQEQQAIQENDARAGRTPGLYEWSTDQSVDAKATKVPGSEPLKIKSDVFTIDPETGEAVGVLTRNQRKNFEARSDVRAQLLIAQKPENRASLRVYKNKGGMLGPYERTAGG